MRSSLSLVQRGVAPSESAFIERNFRISNVFSFNPTRSCLNRTGTLLSIQIATAVANSRGEVMAKPTVAQKISTMRLEIDNKLDFRNPFERISQLGERSSSTIRP